MVERQTILVLDFGSQYTQLIARRVREASVYCEILPFNAPWPEIERRKPKGIILSGGPQSVFAPDSPHPEPTVYDYSGPILGICYGMQLLARHFGGRVEPASRREYGKAQFQQTQKSPLFEGLPERMQVWMSHGDNIEAVPAGFHPIGMTDNSLGAMENQDRKIYGSAVPPGGGSHAAGNSSASQLSFQYL